MNSPPPYVSAPGSFSSGDLKDRKLPSLKDVETVISEEAERWSEGLRKISVEIHGSSSFFFSPSTSQTWLWHIPEADLLFSTLQIILNWLTRKCESLSFRS